MPTEAHARIKINKLLEKAGWRFFDDENGQANICLEGYTKITSRDIDAFGADFEKVESGYLDFLLLDEDGFPFVVLEAKREEKNPLIGKEQARTYAKSKNVRFVILSNGNMHYFWDLEGGNPEIIAEFPTPPASPYRATPVPWWSGVREEAGSTQKAAHPFFLQVILVWSHLEVSLRTAHLT